MTELLTGALEENVLTLLAFHPAHSLVVAATIDAKLFSTRPYRKIAEASLNFISKFREPPRLHLFDLLETELRRGDDGSMLRQVVNQMVELDKHINADYVVSELDRFIALRKMARNIEDALDAVNEGDVSRAWDAIHRDNAPVQTSPGILLSDTKASLKFLDHVEEDYFSMGIRALDDRGIRPTRKTLTMLIAPAKRGKSWFLVNVGKEGVRHGHSVLHVTLEMSEQEVAKRYVQAFFSYSKQDEKTYRIPLFQRDSLNRFTSLEFKNLNPNVLNTKNKAEIAGKLRALRSKPPLIIKGFSSGTLTVGQLTAYLDALPALHNLPKTFRPDLLIVDYPDLMSMAADRVRVDTSRIFVALRGLADSRNMAVVVVTQGGRQSDTAKLVRANMVAEDWSKVATADTVLTYSRTAEEYNAGLARIFVERARGEADQFIVLVTQQYGIGQFCLDSTYMSKYVQDEVSTHLGADDDGD